MHNIRWSTCHILLSPSKRKDIHQIQSVALLFGMPLVHQPVVLSLAADVLDVQIRGHTKTLSVTADLRFGHFFEYICDIYKYLQWSLKREEGLA